MKSTDLENIQTSLTYKTFIEKHKPVNGLVNINFSILENYVSLFQNTKPKKPQSAFLLFLNNRRDSILNDLNSEREDDLVGRDKVTQVSKKAGTIWKEMSEEEKLPYTEKAEGLKEEYSEVLELSKTLNRNEDSIQNSVSISTKEKPKVVSIFKHKGETYLLDKSNGDIYNSETNEIIGKKVENKNGPLIIFN